MLSVTHSEATKTRATIT